MRDEYDFSKGERGKFYQPDAKLDLPVYLDDEVRNGLCKRAKSQDVELSELVNDMLRKGIRQSDSVK